MRKNFETQRKFTSTGSFFLLIPGTLIFIFMGDPIGFFLAILCSLSMISSIGRKGQSEYCECTTLESIPILGDLWEVFKAFLDNLLGEAEDCSPVDCDTCF